MVCDCDQPKEGALLALLVFVLFGGIAYAFGLFDSKPEVKQVTTKKQFVRTIEWFSNGDSDKQWSRDIRMYLNREQYDQAVLDRT